MNENDGELCFLLSDDEHLNESYAKHRSNEAQTPSPHVCAQLFIPHGDERERFCYAMIFWMDVFDVTARLRNICFSFSLLFRRESTTTAQKEKKTTPSTTQQLGSRRRSRRLARRLALSLSLSPFLPYLCISRFVSQP